MEESNRLMCLPVLRPILYLWVKKRVFSQSEPFGGNFELRNRGEGYMYGAVQLSRSPCTTFHYFDAFMKACDNSAFHHTLKLLKILTVWAIPIRSMKV